MNLLLFPSFQLFILVPKFFTCKTSILFLVIFSIYLLQLCFFGETFYFFHLFQMCSPLLVEALFLMVALKSMFHNPNISFILALWFVHLFHQVWDLSGSCWDKWFSIEMWIFFLSIILQGSGSYLNLFVCSFVLFTSLDKSGRGIGDTTSSLLSQNPVS